MSETNGTCGMSPGTVVSRVELKVGVKLLIRINRSTGTVEGSRLQTSSHSLYVVPDPDTKGATICMTTALT
jgi:hypothetical protein